MTDETQSKDVQNVDQAVRQQRNRQIWLILLLLGILVGFGINSYLNQSSTTQVDMQDVEDGDTAVSEVPDAERTFQEGSKIFNRVAKSVRPSVVNITTRVPRRGFFGIPTESENQGTGVVIDQQGHILTNHHVVSGENPTIRVSTHDGDVYEGERIGYDSLVDLAIVRVEGADLTPATMGNSSEVQVGEWVLALGSPFGLEQSVTTGIVSALDRGEHRLPITDRGFLQTDASINPGNSGGPLVNLNGEVIGINTMIVTRGGGSQGVGFAIPINVALNLLERMKQEGEVTWGFLGVTIVNMDEQGLARIADRYDDVDVESPEELASQLGLEEPRGVLILEIQQSFPPQPAQRSDLQQFDVIVEYNGKPVQNRRQFQKKVLNTQPGTEVTMTVVRNGEERDISVEIGER